MRIPETDEPVTRGRVVVDRGAANEKYPPVELFFHHILQ